MDIIPACSSAVLEGLEIFRETKKDYGDPGQAAMKENIKYVALLITTFVTGYRVKSAGNQGMTVCYAYTCGIILQGVDDDKGYTHYKA